MSDTPSAGLRSLRAVCTGILIILVVASLALARAVLLPLALAVLLTFILTPPVVRLQRRGVGRLPAVMLVSILALAVVGGITVLIVLQLRSLAANLPDYRENIARKAAAIRQTGPGNVIENIQNALGNIHDELAGTDLATPPEQKPMPVEIQQRGTARFEAMAGPVLSVLANVILVAVLVVFMLFTHEDLRDRLIRLVSHGRLTDTTKALEDASRRVSRFLQMQLVINIGFGLALGLGLFLIGLPQAFLWGLLVGALRFVPYLGSLFGALILVVLSVALFPGWEQPLEVFGFFLLLELSIANALEPLLIGRSTGVSPLALLIAAAFWTWLWGPMGLLLSTPFTVCLVVLGRYVSGLEFFGVLLGDEPALTPGQRYYQRLLAQDPDEAIDLVEEHLKTSPREPFYDAVLLTALVLARRDSEDGTLPSAREQALLRDMRQILEEVLPVRCPPSGSGAAWEQTGPLVLGIPANGEGDELALSMLQQLLVAEKCRFEVLPAGLSVTEAVARVVEQQPAGVCIAALPPSGLAKSRFLCKRLRAELPELGILVGRWGEKYAAEQAAERCRAAGANAVGATLLESRVQLLSLLEEPAIQPRQAEAIAEEASAVASV